ncbi:hypothetical protein [Methylovirgula sp. HY1]|uniref:hypothetical protein n=1 Tax=Methylovirgula sp. HY1 TaxID=2822761 RepID=UPI001C5B9328|nr:hypothetical protein [Methylovirgula sp. HY1]
MGFFDRHLPIENTRLKNGSLLPDRSSAIVFPEITATPMLVTQSVNIVVDGVRYGENAGVLGIRKKKVCSRRKSIRRYFIFIHLVEIHEAKRIIIDQIMLLDKFHYLIAQECKPFSVFRQSGEKPIETQESRVLATLTPFCEQCLRRIDRVIFNKNEECLFRLSRKTLEIRQYLPRASRIIAHASYEND